MSDQSSSAAATIRAVKKYDREELIKIGQQCQAKPLPEGVSLADFSLIDPATLEPERNFERRSIGDDGPSFKPAWAKGGRGGEGGLVRPSYPVPIRSKLVDMPAPGDEDGASRVERNGALSSRSSWRGGEDRLGSSYTDRDRDREPRGPRDSWEASRSPSGPPGLDRGAPAGTVRSRWGTDRDKDGWRSNSLKEDRWRGGDDGGDRRGQGPEREPPGYGSRDGLAGAPGRDDRERWGRRPGTQEEGFQEDSGRWTDERRRRANDPPPPPRGHYGDRDRDRDHRSSGDYYRTGGSGNDYHHAGGGHEPEWMAEEGSGGDGRRGGGSGGGGAAAREERPPVVNRPPAGASTRLTAADVERERQAFRAMANKEKEAPKPKHGLFDVEEIDLDELRDEDDDNAALATNRPHSQPSAQPQSAHQQQSVASAPRSAMGVEELERRMAAGAAAGTGVKPVLPPPGFGGPAAPAPPPGFGAPPPAAPAAASATSAAPAAQASASVLGAALGALGGNAAGKALLGMLKRGASGDPLVPPTQLPQQQPAQATVPNIPAPPAPALSALLPPGFPPAVRPPTAVGSAVSLPGPNPEQRQDQQQTFPQQQLMLQQQQHQPSATQPPPPPLQQQQPVAPSPPQQQQQQSNDVAPSAESAAERQGGLPSPLPNAVPSYGAGGSLSVAASAPPAALQAAVFPPATAESGSGISTSKASFPSISMMSVAPIPEGVRNAFADAKLDGGSGTSMAQSFSSSFGSIWGTPQLFSQALKPQESSSVPLPRPVPQQPATAMPAAADHGGSNSTTTTTSGPPQVTAASTNPGMLPPVRPAPSAPAQQLPSAQPLLPPQQQQLPPQLQALLGIQPHGQHQAMQQQQAPSAAGLALFQQHPGLGQQQQHQLLQQGGVNVRNLPESHPLHALFARAAGASKQQPSQPQQQPQAALGQAAPQPHVQPQQQQPQGSAPASGLTGQPKPGAGMDPLSLLLGQLGRAQAQAQQAPPAQLQQPQQQPGLPGFGQPQLNVSTVSGLAGLHAQQVQQQQHGAPPYGQRVPFVQPAAPTAPQNAMQQLQQQLRQLQFGAAEGLAAAQQPAPPAATPAQAPTQPSQAQSQGSNVVAQLHQMLQQAAAQQQQQAQPAITGPGAQNFFQQLMSGGAGSTPGSATALGAGATGGNLATLQALQQLQALQAGAAARAPLVPPGTQQLPPHLHTPTAGAFTGSHAAHQAWPQAMALNPALAAAAAAAATRPAMQPPMGGGSGGGAPGGADATSLARFLNAAALQAAVSGNAGGSRLPLGQASSVPGPALQGGDLERLLQMQAVARQQSQGQR